MANGFEDLARRLDRLAVEFERGAERVVRSAAILADQVLVLGTPVDTGRARGGWQVSQGSPDFSEGELDPTGAAALARGRSGAMQFRIGGTLYISNAVPYIGPLDRGHSPQAPDGFTREALAQTRAFLQRQRYLRGG